VHEKERKTCGEGLWHENEPDGSKRKERTGKITNKGQEIKDETGNA